MFINTYFHIFPTKIQKITVFYHYDGDKQNRALKTTQVISRTNMNNEKGGKKKNGKDKSRKKF